MIGVVNQRRRVLAEISDRRKIGDVVFLAEAADFCELYESIVMLPFS